MRAKERGSVAVEFAVMLPALALLVIGGWVLGYLAYAKVALAMVANRAARDLAANVEEYDRFPAITRPFRYEGGISESFGLPRWGIHALADRTFLVKKKESEVGRTKYAVVVAVCYRVPFTLPGLSGRKEPKQHLPDTSDYEKQILDVADLVGPELTDAVQDYQHAKQALEEEIARWDRLIEEGERAVQGGDRLVDKGRWLARTAKQLFQRSPRDFETVGEKRIVRDTLEELVKQECSPPDRFAGDSLVLTARASYLMHEVYKP